MLASGSFAQIGDRQDKAGEVQKSLVPPERIPPAPALTPEQALKSFKLAPGIRLELAAAEPQVQEPVAVAFAADGRMHTGDMPAFGAALNDEQISSVLTYLRRERGHTAPPIEPAHVKTIRAETAGHNDAWSADELAQFK